MKVKELIAKLKKMPQDNHVYWQDFDCDEFGMSSAVESVFLQNFDTLNDQQEDQNEFKLKGNIVILRG